MNEMKHHRCDMCGRIIMDKTKCGYLGKTYDNPEQYSIVVCHQCYDHIERYINEYGMVNGYTN